jgi:hypothetical protein
MRHLQSPAYPCNARPITRNEQESGSSPLVGSPLYYCSQLKREGEDMNQDLS